jgi:hypothetical protein
MANRISRPGGGGGRAQEGGERVVWRWGRAVGEGRFPIHRTSDMGVLDNASVVHVIRLGRTRVHFRVLAVVPPPPKARNPECTGRTPEVIPHPDQRNMISAAVHTEIPNPGTSLSAV